MKIKNIYTLYLIFLLIPFNSKAVTFGSDTAVSRFNARITLSTGDLIAGFAAIQGGFIMASSAATATFNSFFPVSSELNFNGGTLILNRDLIVSDTATIPSWGSITGNNFNWSLSPGITVAPSRTASNNLYTISNLITFLNGNLTLQNSNLSFTGTCVINGQGNILSFNPTVTLLVGAGSNLTFKNITLKNISGTRIQCVDRTGVINFDNVELILDGNYSFTQGLFNVIRELDISGNGYRFVYGTDQVSTVSTSSTLFLDTGLTFSYSPRIANKTLLKFVDSTSLLALNSATFHTTTTAVNFTKGKILVEGRSYLSNSGTVNAEAIQFGDGAASSNNMTIEWLPAANLELIGGIALLSNV